MSLRTAHVLDVYQIIVETEISIARQKREVGGEQKRQIIVRDAMKNVRAEYEIKPKPKGERERETHKNKVEFTATI